jgi:hypothetical protein
VGIVYKLKEVIYPGNLMRRNKKTKVITH